MTAAEPSDSMEWHGRQWTDKVKVSNKEWKERVKKVSGELGERNYNGENAPSH